MLLCLFGKRSQMTSQCGKQNGTYNVQPSVSLMFLPHHKVLTVQTLNNIEILQKQNVDNDDVIYVSILQYPVKMHVKLQIKLNVYRPFQCRQPGMSLNPATSTSGRKWMVFQVTMWACPKVIFIKFWIRFPIPFILISSFSPRILFWTGYIFL